MNDINQISMEKIKAWFGKIRSGRSSYDKTGIKPARDWKMMLVFAAVVFCLEAALAWFVYFQVESGAWVSEPQETTPTEVSINQNLLQKVAGEVGAKAAAYSATSTDKGPADPSL